MSTSRPLLAALYARVSTTDQTCENQLLELRRYCEARGWTAAEYVDTGISGAKDRRPALDRLMTNCRQRRIDAVVVWRLDRFGRNLRHLITAIEELNAAGVAFVSMGESIDTGSPTGRLIQIVHQRVAWIVIVSVPLAVDAGAAVPASPVVVIARIVPSSVRHRPSFAHSSRRLGCP
jgi:hypothetical protein